MNCKLVEKEVFGLDYERYSLSKVAGKIARKYNIKSVLEIPAGGVKAMPSIYSLGFAQAGCHVSLVNASKNARKIWKSLGLDVQVIDQKDLTKLTIEDNSFDLVWNFASFPSFREKDNIFREFIRVSNRYVSLFCVNGRNCGSYVHRTLHKIYRVPWTHGDKFFIFPNNVKNYFLINNLKLVEFGVADCPPWPDSIGFRDMRLHRENIDFDSVEWKSNTLDYIKENSYPSWIKALYFLECIPSPIILKLVYSHLFYVIGKK